MQNIDYSCRRIAFLRRSVTPKKRVTSSRNSLYVQENIAIEDDFEESAVKMISPFEYGISGPRDRARSVLSQN